MTLAKAIATRKDAPADADAAVGKVLRGMTDEAECDAVLTFVESIGDAAKRTPYRLEMAHAKGKRAKLSGRELGAKSADAEAAIGIAGAIIDELNDEQKRELNKLRFTMHLLRATFEKKDDYVAQAESYERALHVAVGQADNAELRQLALRILPDVEALFPKLPQDMRDSITKLKAQLEAAAGGN